MSTAQRASLDGAEMSVDEFLALPDDGVHRELIRGVVREESRSLGIAVESVEASMTYRNRFHASCESRVNYFLRRWLEDRPNPRGDVVSGEAGFRLRGTRDSLVSVDVAYVSAEQLSATPSDQRIFDGPPVLAVEILSGSETFDELAEKVRASTEAGAVVWVIDPEFRTVTIHVPAREPVGLNIGHELAGDPYLPGFRVAVRELFA